MKASWKDPEGQVIMNALTLFCTFCTASLIDGGLYWFVCVLGPAEQKGKSAVHLSGGSISADKVQDNYKQYWSFFRRPKEIELTKNVPAFVFFGEDEVETMGPSGGLFALLLDYNKQPNIKPVKLKAIALGNPLLDIEISVNDAEYLWSHGVISDEMLMLKNTVASTTIVGDPCLQDRVFIYLNKPQVQEALQANTTHLSYSWSFCSGPG
ncbi:unnamed protein product [Camellia sinensis]